MFLKTLTIASEHGIIREIKFREGINLIVDETPIITGKETGNNVGKTTVLKLIDFCLGGNAKAIYTDPENPKHEYELVKNFLIENRVVITLVLTDDLADSNARELHIERNFLARNAGIRRINGELKTEDEFKESLTNFFFSGHYGKKPTFRQIISHNIRYKDITINNTLKTLDRYTSDAEYETLYLFLLGCDFFDGNLKQELLAKIKLEDAFKSRLEKTQTRSAYEAALVILDREITILDKRKLSFNLNENFEADLVQLNAVRYETSILSSEIGKLNIRRQLILEAQSDLENSVSNIDLRQLEYIYEQANANIKGIQKTFNDLHTFHNQMIYQKVRYIAKDLPRINDELASKSYQLNQLLQKDAKLAAALACSESFEALEKLIQEINEKYRRKGECQNMIAQLVEVDANLKDLNCRLDKIDDDLFSNEFEEKISLQIGKFNQYFSAISEKIYGEQYALKFDEVANNKGQRLYKFSAFNTNFSSGKKQGEISCFDIAYTLFADQEKISCLHFLLNDKKELMHDNQLLKIADLVEGNNLQFVASILKDKLPEALTQEDWFVVKLSQTDKLFRIERRGLDI